MSVYNHVVTSSILCHFTDASVLVLILMMLMLAAVIQSSFIVYNRVIAQVDEIISVKTMSRRCI